MDGRPTPAASFVKKEATPASSVRQSNLVNPSDASTGVAGHVSNSLFIFELLSAWFRRFHFDPFGTEFM